MPGAPAKACAPRGTRAPQEGRDGCAAAAADAREMVVYGRGKMGGHIKGRAGGAHAPKRERNGRPSAAVALVAPAAAVAAAAVPAAAPEAATTTLATPGMVASTGARVRSAKRRNSTGVARAEVRL